jgi:hypothetical protein
LELTSGVEPESWMPLPTRLPSSATARLLAAVFQPGADKCTKGRFSDRASDKLSQLGKFAANELVPFDVQAVAEALSSQ